jgi:serine/threonine-protein kinase
VIGSEPFTMLAASARATAPTRVRAEGTAPPVDRDDDLPVPGQRLGRYVVHRVLGGGGMGLVVAAHDPELARDVAIKLVRPSLWRAATDASRGLLRREAQAMARLDHPNVVAVHDVGTDDGRLFVAMQLVAGESLDEWRRSAPRSWRQVLAVCLGAAAGLAAAHRAGLVHRDVKPHNILVGDDGAVRVADFGLALLRRPDGCEHDATPCGTPAYMAPEQHRGEPTDERSDQFAFCVTVFEALHGCRPYPGRRPDEIAASIAEGRLRIPARGGVPRHVDQALRRGLAAAPAARFATMDELIAALAPRRSRAPTLAAAVLVGAAVIASAVAAWPVTAAPDADAPTTRGVPDADRRLGLARARLERATSHDQLRAVADEARALGAGTLLADALLAAGVRAAGSDAEGAERDLREAVRVAAAIGRDRVVADAWTALIVTLAASGRLDEAEHLRPAAEAARLRAGHRGAPPGLGATAQVAADRARAHHAALAGFLTGLPWRQGSPASIGR